VGIKKGEEIRTSACAILGRHISGRFGACQNIRVKGEQNPTNETIDYRIKESDGLTWPPASFARKKVKGVWRVTRG